MTCEHGPAGFADQQLLLTEGDIVDRDDVSTTMPHKLSTVEESLSERDSPQVGEGSSHVGPQAGGEDVSRETPVIRTASDLADSTESFASPYGDEATPLAQAAEHMLLARHGVRMREPLPRPGGTAPEPGRPEEGRPPCPESPDPSP